MLEYGSDMFYDILRYHNGSTYSYVIGDRAFIAPKIDGSFSFHNGIYSSSGLSTISFIKDNDNDSPYTLDHYTYDNYDNKNDTFVYVVDYKPASEEKFSEALDVQRYKPDLVWYDLTDENLKLLLDTP